MREEWEWGRDEAVEKVGRRNTVGRREDTAGREGGVFNLVLV